MHAKMSHYESPLEDRDDLYYGRGTWSCYFLVFDRKNLSTDHTCGNEILFCSYYQEDDRNDYLLVKISRERKLTLNDEQNQNTA